jgi:hypothetical protein
VSLEGWYDAPPAQKGDTLTARLQSRLPGGTKLFVMHVELDSPGKMSAMENLDSFGPEEMSNKGRRN